MPDPARALIVIDLQNGFCPGGNLAVPDGDAIVPGINALMDEFAHVILTQDWHPAGHSSFASSHPGRGPYEVVEMDYGPQVLWPDHCVQGTQDAAFHPDLATDRARAVVRKGMNPAVDSYSAFFENDQTTTTGLAGWLREKGVTRIFAAGLATDFCVAWTCLDARRCGFEAVLVEDACRAINQNGSLAQAMANMEKAGVIIARENQIGE